MTTAAETGLPGGRAGPRVSHATARPVLEESDVARALIRIAHEILERTKGARETVVLGIPTRGVFLARRLGERIERFEGRRVPVGSLDVTMYRDDLRLRPARALEPTRLPPGGIDGKRVVLVDDVLFSGRTVRAALDALGELGRPRAVQLAVLVDRGHRELPIRADYVGKNLPTSLHETVRVLCHEIDGRDAVLLGPGDSDEDGSALPEEAREQAAVQERVREQPPVGRSAQGPREAGPG